MLFGQSIKAKGFFGVGFHLVVQLRILGLARTKLPELFPDSRTVYIESRFF